MIVIKNMKMPHNCGECPMAGSFICKCTHSSFTFDAPEGFDYLSRMPDCPLIEVPDSVIGGYRKWDDNWQ